MIRPLYVVRPPPQPSPMRRLFASLHEHLIDAIQAGRRDDAYDYARLLAFLGPRL